jgi:preprotein translocase subunit SecB
MDKQILSTFRFVSYKIQNIQYSINKAFFSEEPIEMEYGLHVNIEVAEDKHEALVSLYLSLFEEAEKNNYPFSLKLDISGLFSTDDDIEVDKFMEFCKINGTAILYPYLRSAVTDITKVVNEQPLVMPLVNVYGLILNNEQEEMRKNENNENMEIENKS